MVTASELIEAYEAEASGGGKAKGKSKKTSGGGTKAGTAGPSKSKAAPIQKVSKANPLGVGAVLEVSKIVSCNDRRRRRRRRRRVSRLLQMPSPSQSCSSADTGAVLPLATCR